MRSFTPPLYFTKSIHGSLLILCGTLLSAGAVETPRAKPAAGHLPGPRLEMPASSHARSEVLTLQEAYDEALLSDESIQLAYFKVRKARLLRWQALAVFEPSVSANIGRRENDADRTTVQNNLQRRDIREAGTQSSSGTRSTADHSIADRGTLPDSFTNENFFSNSQSLTSRPRDTLNTRTSDFLSERTNRDTAAIILQQPLLDLTVFPAYRLGRLAEEAAQLSFQFTIRDVLLGVTRAYYDALKQEHIVAVTQQTLDLSTKQLELAKERFTAGAALRTEVLRAEATAADARRLMILNEGALGTAKDVLRSILDRPDGAFRLVEPARGVRTAQPMPAMLAQALAQREDYRTSSNTVSQEQERRNKIAASFMPKVNAEFRARSFSDSNNGSTRGSEQRTLSSTGTTFDSNTQSASGTETRTSEGGGGLRTAPASKSSTERNASSFSSIRTEKRTDRNSSRYSTDETEWEALLTLQMPLGGERTLELRNAGYLVSDAEINRLKLGKTIERELYDATIQVTTLAETVKLLHTEVDAAEQNYKDLQSQYENGTATSVDLLVALRDLNKVRTQLVSDTYDYEFSLRNLQRTMGTFETDRVKNLRFTDYGRHSQPKAPAIQKAPESRPRKK